MDGYLGEIRIIACNFTPRNWLKCEGQLLQIQQYAALYALLGVQYGGDAKNNFALPDLRGRLPIGTGRSPTVPQGSNYQAGQKGGVESVVLTTSQIAQHIHPATFTPGQGSSTSVTASIPVSTTVPAVGPQLTNGQPAYLANATAGSGGTALKGIFSSTAPAAGATATIPVNAQITGGAGTVTVGANTPPSSAVPLLNPYLALNYCICIDGLFPGRN